MACPESAKGVVAWRCDIRRSRGIMVAIAATRFLPLLTADAAFNLEIYLMAEQSVVGVFENTTQARAAIDKLVASGFPNGNISLVTKSLTSEPAAVKKTLEFGDRKSVV